MCVIALGFLLLGTTHNAAAAEQALPRFFAIITGISQYAEPKKVANLKYAAKDARDMATALTVAAGKLFPGRVNIQLLTSEPTSNSGEAASVNTGAARREATKQNIESAFRQLAQQAQPQDIVVVFFAGHGVAVRQDGDSYYYFTQDARTVEIAESPFKEWFISSAELGSWSRRIAAKKQVLILDTCAAGALTNGAKDTENRNLSPDQVRALQRLKDSVGFYVLMGSAANAVSYEASKFNQGLLTYALIEGMRGRALRDGKFVDVLSLFNYAVGRVPQLASGIGGIQTPRIAVPGSADVGNDAPKRDSFDIGLVDETNRTQIPLAAELPQLRLALLSEKPTDVAVGTLPTDRLNLGAELHDALKQLAGTGGFVLVEEGDPPGLIIAGGRYTTRDDKITARLTLRRDGQPFGQPLELSDSSANLRAFAEKLAATVREAIFTAPFPREK